MATDTGKNPKTPQDGRKTLVAAVAADDSVAHLTLAWRDNPPSYTVKYVELEDSVAAEFLSHAQATAAHLAQHRVHVQYDPEWPLGKQEYFRLSGNEIPGANLFEDLSDFLALEVFQKTSLRSPRLYTVAVQTPKGNAFFGKRMAYLKVLTRRKGIFAAVWDGDTFSELEASVATFSTNFDWVLWDDVLYVLDGRNFHAEFRDNKALRDAVQDHVDTISQYVEIVGADDFAARCQASVPMASKLKSVVDGGIWKEPVEKLKEYADERGIDVEWDGDALVFDGSIEHQFAILKLLAEDRTHGPVSGRTYDSAAKRTVQVTAATSS